MQELTLEDEVTRIRRQHSYKEIHYSTLENELLKRNDEMLALKGTLDEALNKLRNEADRAVRLEDDLHKRSEDLRGERLARQNLETSLDSTREKLKAEEQTCKHLKMELEEYACRITFQHQGELGRLQREKIELEARVRAFQSQPQAQQPSQVSTMSAYDERVAGLEADLSTTKQELYEVSQALSDARQEATKSSNLQSKLITAENGQLRAERLAGSEKKRADDMQVALQESEEELIFWRSMAKENSEVAAKLEILRKERDEAVEKEKDVRSHQEMMRNRLDEMEVRETLILKEREEALDALQQLKVHIDSTSSIRESENDTLVEDLRATLAERETALLKARGYSTELQKMYRDTVQACEAAEARVLDLELRYTSPRQDHPPLIIVSPPPSPCPSAPFVAAAQPATAMSSADVATVERLLNAIERLRSERDALRRNLNFAEMEHRVVVDTLRGTFNTVECLSNQTSTGVQTQEDEVCGDGDEETRQFKNTHQRRPIKASDDPIALVEPTVEIAERNAELKHASVQLQELDDSQQRISTSREKASRVTLALLIIIQHLASSLEEAEKDNCDISQECDTQFHRHNEPLEAHERTESSLSMSKQSGEAPFSAKEFLASELATNDDDYSESLRTSHDGDGHTVRTEAQLPELQVAQVPLKQLLADSKLNVVSTVNLDRSTTALEFADTEVAALKLKLEDFEQRVLRRTEQIGMQQHDIKRLETNLRVAEDTIGELSLEVEALTKEKECLVQDCAQARDARDDAHQKLEALEVEIETLAKEKERLADSKSSLEAESIASERRIKDLTQTIAESIETSTQRQEAAQLEIRGLEHALSCAQVQLDELDASKQAMQREKVLIQGERMRLEAELEKSVTKYQYMEQRARESDQDIVRHKEEINSLRAETAKCEEAAHRAEVDLSFSAIHFEQKLATMQRELQKQQGHHQCQESISELKEKNEYLEEVLRMKSVEIEENDDRFIEVLKEKKRLNGKVEWMARKIQNLQTKLAAISTQQSSSSAATTTPTRETVSPPMPPPLPSTGSIIAPRTRIPSSPAIVLRAKTPEPSRNQVASKTPEPPMPILPQAFKIRTPESRTTVYPFQRAERPLPLLTALDSPMVTSNRKRRAPDEFDEPARIPTQVVVTPGADSTPHKIRHDGRSGFTPMRIGRAVSVGPNPTQPSPSMRVTTPLSERTNSPRASRTESGKAVTTKPPIRSWLTRSRPPMGGGLDMRTNANHGRP